MRHKAIEHERHAAPLASGDDALVHTRRDLRHPRRASYRFERVQELILIVCHLPCWGPGPDTQRLTDPDPSRAAHTSTLTRVSDSVSIGDAVPKLSKRRKREDAATDRHATAQSLGNAAHFEQVLNQGHAPVLELPRRRVELIGERADIGRWGEEGASCLCDILGMGAPRGGLALFVRPHVGSVSTVRRHNRNTPKASDSRIARERLRSDTTHNAISA